MGSPSGAHSARSADRMAAVQVTIDKIGNDFDGTLDAEIPPTVRGTDNAKWK